MKILNSAFKHGITAGHIRQVMSRPLRSLELRKDPLKVMVVGIDYAFRTLEVCYTIDKDGEIVVFHAMPATGAAIEKMFRRTTKENKRT